MEDNIFISQSRYAKNVVNKSGLKKESYDRTLVLTHVKLSRDDNGVDVDQSLYRSMIDSLLYLITSRPDITFVVSVCAIYQDKPKDYHLTQVKRIMKYINGTNHATLQTMSIMLLILSDMT